MNKKLIQPARKLWHNWKRIAFTSQMLIHKKQQKAVTAPEYDPTLEDDVVLVSGQKDLPEILKTVWIWWPNLNLPESVALMVNAIRASNPDHEITVLNQRTLSHWLPELNFTSSDLTLEHKSDVIRLELLYRYGGIWIDCNTLLFEDLSWVHRIHQEKPMDLIGYYREISTVNYLSPVIENWFLAAAPQNPFIREWLKQLAPIKNLGAQNYFHEMKKRDDYPWIVQKIDDPLYQLSYLAQQVAIKEYRKINVFLRKCEANAFYYQSMQDRDNGALARMVMFNQRPQTPPPIIRLTGNEQLHLDFNLKLGFYNRTSIIGEMMQARTRQPTLALASAVDKASA
ncbi:glycosyltransferase family 32 protein [Pantoea sp.]|uniref:glycosyltransferase family 32 protein n=1 Tax=Pantoea sp. TaxID=69393 RepID=UPI00289A2978|nr:capsular polysaccharide synthesis protein [Pantoea sp.]